MIRLAAKLAGFLKAERVYLTLASLEAVSSYVENVHAARRPLDLARLAKTALLTKEQY